MHTLGILVFMLYDLSLGLPVAVDTVIVQVQQWAVVGTQQVVEQVLLNGFSLIDTSQEVDSIIQSMSPDALFHTHISANQSSLLRNHTFLRSRECILEGSHLHWTDRVFYDGMVYLTLDHTDKWKAHVPQALALKALWDQEVQRTRAERINLQEGCIKLMRELRLSVELPDTGTPFPHFLIPVLAILAFFGLITFSLFLSQKLGRRHPGGVIGSVIHYPKDMTEMSPGVNSGYQTL